MLFASTAYSITTNHKFFYQPPKTCMWNMLLGKVLFNNFNIEKFNYNQFLNIQLFQETKEKNRIY